LEATKRFNLEQWYECEDCKIKFSTQKPLKRKAFCPNCGESFTERIKRPRITSRETYKPWKDSELELIEKVINKELKVYQVALMLDRSRKSVANKAGRTRRSNENAIRNK
jgi:protein-arginine kinase activator protein McsA